MEPLLIAGGILVLVVCGVLAVIVRKGRPFAAGDVFFFYSDGLTDALDVLDETPESHLERAAILRAQGKWSEAIARYVR